MSRAAWLLLPTAAALSCTPPDGARSGDADARHPAERSPEIEVYDARAVLPEGLPFSEAVRVGNTLYLSGQVGIVPGSLELVDGGLPAEARQTMENIAAMLEAHGYAMRDVVKCTVMLTDMSRWAEFNDIYVTYFSAPYPARSAIGATGLALGAEVEVECIAARSADAP